MPPFSGAPTPENSSKKPKSPSQQYRIISSTTNYYFNFNTITKRYSYIPIHPRLCLIIFIITLQISLLTLSYYHPFYPVSTTSSLSSLSSLSPSHNINVNYTTTKKLDSRGMQPQPSCCGCDLGKFYIYDLPKEFNVEIHKNCDNLSPWGSRCSAFANNGFGLGASEINSVIPASLKDTWYWTDQFSSEIIFHNRLLNHKCRTLDPESAAAYYIPFYAGLEVGKFLWGNKSLKERDAHCEMMLDFISKLPHFNNSKGWDHFLVMGRITWDFRRTKDEDWGSKCIHMPSMRNITRLLIERNPWDYLDVGVPYPTGFHPNTDSEVAQWQEFVTTRERKSLFCFVGGTRGLIPNDFRGLLLNQCRNSGESCRVVDCSGTRCANDTSAGTSQILETFLDSEFCLQPRGDSFTRRSIFECMIAGSIPVFFWKRSAYVQYEWFLPDQPDSYSVFIHRDEVKNGTFVKSVLERYTKDEVKRMREKVVEHIPKFIYAKPNQGLGTIKDAVDIAVDGVLRRIKEQKENGYYW